MPTERCGKIGYLLRHGKAHVVSRVPFVVQLDYDSTTYTQDVSLGIDAGSNHIGVSASSEKNEMQHFSKMPLKQLGNALHTQI